MNDLIRSKTLRDSLKAKIEKSMLSVNDNGHIEIPNYEEERKTGNIQGMLKAKLYGNQYKYEAVADTIKDKDINTLRIEKKSLELRLKGIEEEKERELERLEKSITDNLEIELKECNNRLSKDLKISQYLKYTEEQKALVSSKYDEKIKGYNIELLAYEDKETEFLEENKSTIERIKKEETEKQIREMVLREKAENVKEVIKEEDIKE